VDYLKYNRGIVEQTPSNDKGESLNLFPTLVMKFTNVLSSENISQIYQTLRTDQSLKEDNTLINGHSNFESKEDILNKLNLRNIMQEKVDLYCMKAKFTNIIVANSWFSIQSIGGMLEDHIHAGSLLSGVFYINTDDSSSPLVFHNPNLASTHAYGFYNERSEYNFDLFRVKPENGDLYIFPSWLRHGCNYIPNQTQERVIISFNTLSRLTYT